MDEGVGGGGDGNEAGADDEDGNSPRWTMVGASAGDCRSGSQPARRRRRRRLRGTGAANAASSDGGGVGNGGEGGREFLRQAHRRPRRIFSRFAVRSSAPPRTRVSRAGRSRGSRPIAPMTRCVVDRRRSRCTRKAATPPRRRGRDALGARANGRARARTRRNASPSGSRDLLAYLLKSAGEGNEGEGPSPRVARGARRIIFSTDRGRLNGVRRL